MRAWALASIWIVTAACGTVDPGPDLVAPPACNPPPAFFVTDIWPSYFQTYGCGNSDCHDSQRGRGYFRLSDVSAVLAPAPTASVASWPEPWRTNLLNVQRNLSCAEPLASPVLSVPSGRSLPHPPGVTVTDIPAADALFNMWIP